MAPQNPPAGTGRSAGRAKKPPRLSYTVVRLNTGQEKGVAARGFRSLDNMIALVCLKCSGLVAPLRNRPQPSAERRKTKRDEANGDGGRPRSCA